MDSVNTVFDKASADEQSLIKSYLQKAKDIAPGVQICFVERQTDELGTMLRIGLKLPEKAQSPVNNETAQKEESTPDYQLHQLAEDLYEEGKYALTMTLSDTGKSGKLLRLRPFLPEQDLASHNEDGSAPEPAIIKIVRSPLLQSCAIALILFAVMFQQQAQVRKPTVVLSAPIEHLPERPFDPKVDLNVMTNHLKVQLDQSISILTNALKNTVQDADRKKLEKEKARLEQMRKELDTPIGP